MSGLGETILRLFELFDHLFISQVWLGPICQKSRTYGIVAARISFHLINLSNDASCQNSR
jgi:hypothetical protein